MFPLCVFMLFACVFFSAPVSSFFSNAFTSGTTPASIGSLTFADYDTRTDGQVFDPVVLNKLYDMALGTNGKGSYKKLYDTVNSSNSTIRGSALDASKRDWTQPHSMDFAAISQGTAGDVGTKVSAPNPITVEFGGFEWSVVYLTTNTTSQTDGKPDLIATLWATNIIDKPDGSNWFDPFNSFEKAPNSATDPYISSVYSTSKLRVESLNAAGTHNVNYAVSATSRTGVVSQSAREANQFAHLTMDAASFSNSADGKKSLTKYLVQPKHLLYQEKENAVWASLNRSYSVYLLPSEAWGIPDSSFQNDGGKCGWNPGAYANYSPLSNTSSPAYSTYNEWANDYLWLPSLTEIGYNDNVTHANGVTEKGTSLWGIPNGHDIQKARDYYWTRSGAHHNSKQAILIDDTGRLMYRMDSNCGVNSLNAIRPALHLNLTKAAAAIVDIPEQPENSKPTYSGVEQTIDLTAFTNFDANKMYVTNIVKKDTSAGTVSPSVDMSESDATKRKKVKVTDAGTYTVTLKAKTGTVNGVANSQYFWSERTPPSDPTETTIEFVVKKKQLTPPVISSTDGDKTYNGSKQRIEITGYPNTKVADSASPPNYAYPVDPMSVVVSAKRGESAYTPGYTVVTKTSADNNGTLTLEFRDAAEYTVTFSIADTVNYEWADKETNGAATRETTYSVKPKQLSFSYETDYKAGTAEEDKTKLSWTATDGYSATFTVGEIYTGTDTEFPTADGVKIKLKLGKTGDSSFSAEIKGSFDGSTGKSEIILDSSAFPGSKYAPGTYPITFEMDDNASGSGENGNYSFADALTSWNNKALVITASGAGLEEYTFTYTKKKDNATNAEGSDGTPVIGSVDMALPAGNKLSYSYDEDLKKGYVYELNVDTTEFAGAHIKIDESRGDEGFVGGYKNQRASKAGKYKTVVALVTTSDDYLFQKEDGSTSKTLEVEIEWEIEKLSVELDGIEWQYAGKDGTAVYAKWDKSANGGAGGWVYADGKGGYTATEASLEWKSGNYTLTLGNLPGGVTVKNGSSYVGNQEKYVGKYTAKVSASALVYDKENYNTVSIPDLSWSIGKAKIELSENTWDVDETTAGGEDDKIFYLPHVISVYDGVGIEYEIYDLGTTKPPETITNLGSKIELSAIEWKNGTVHYYCVKAVIKSGLSSDGVTAWEDALMFVDEEGNEIKDTTDNINKLIKEFTTGDNRTPVQVTGTLQVTYDGKAHGTLKTAGNPKGEIEVKVGENTFSDVELVWYEYSESATGHKGTPVGSAPTAAGKYTIEIKLKESATEDYVLMKQTLTFEIEKFKFDMTGVKWGYLEPKKDETGKPVLDKDGNPVMEEVEFNPGVPLPYKVKLDKDGKPVIGENGKPVAEEYELVLIGLPKGDANGDEEARLLAEMFEASGLGGSYYGGNGVFTLSGNKASAVTGGVSNKAQYVIDASKLGDNFELHGMPNATELPNAGKTLDWKIEAKKLKKPEDSSGALVFSGSAQELLKAAGLDANEQGIYYTVTALKVVTPDGELQVLDPKEIGNCKDAGEYRITAALTDTNNLRWDDNGILKTAAQQFKVTVGVLELTVSDWSGDGKEPWVPIFGNGEEEVPKVWRSEIEDSYGNIYLDDSYQDKVGETFTQRLIATEGNEKNVTFKYGAGVEEEKRFTILSDETVPVQKPKVEEVNKKEGYTGKEQSFLPEGLSALLGNGRAKVYAVDEEGKETEVDEKYFTQVNAGKYRVRIRLQGVYVWSDTEDKTPLDFEFEIEAAEISPEWKTDKDGKPVAEAPAGYEHLGEIYEYHYYDADGKEVSEKELQGGVEYTVGVSIKEEYKNNFILQDKTGNTPADGVVRSEDTYTPESTGLMQSVMGLPLWLWLIILIIILFLLILFIILIAKKRKKSKEAKALNAEKQEEKDRIEAEKREREEEKRRKEEEREEEKRRKEEERLEEKRRKEEEREEEKRRREEEREEEKRRREDRMEDERRRMEDERRRREEMAAASALNSMANPMNNMNGMQGGMGMQQGAYMPPQMPMQAPQPYVAPQMPYGQQYAPYAPQPQPPVQPQPQPQTVYVERSSGGSRGDGEAYARLHEYESRLRSLERELEEKRIESIRNEEHARAQEEMRALAEQRRREEELQRLRALQSEQSQRLKEEEARYRERYDAAREMRERRRELEEERLRALEEQIRRKEADNRALEARFRETYAPYPQEVIRYDDPNGRRR